MAKRHIIANVIEKDMLDGIAAPKVVTKVLVELMEANNLKQKDLEPLLGSESVVSEVLRGKRELNKHHIERLSKRFGVSPAVFF